MYKIAVAASLSARDRWDISAKPENEISRRREGDEQLRAMLRALLAERFGLSLHAETKEMAVYALLAGRSGPKLRRHPKGRKAPAFPWAGAK